MAAEACRSVRIYKVHIPRNVISGPLDTSNIFNTTMPPIRRYLRISKYSVLECRIYLENPSDTRWLLDSRDPVLPRVFAAIRPLVLPKLREENERFFARKRGHPVKDVIAEGIIIITMIVSLYVVTDWLLAR